MPPAGATAYNVAPSGATAGSVAATDTPAAVVHRLVPELALTEKKARLAATPTNPAAVTTTPAADDTPGVLHKRLPVAESMPVKLVVVTALGVPWPVVLVKETHRMPSPRRAIKPWGVAPSETVAAADHSMVPVAASNAAGKYEATGGVGGENIEPPVPVAYTKSCEPSRSGVPATFNCGMLHSSAPVAESRARIPLADMLKAANMLYTITPALHLTGEEWETPENMAGNPAGTVELNCSLHRGLPASAPYWAGRTEGEGVGEGAT